MLSQKSGDSEAAVAACRISEVPALRSAESALEGGAADDADQNVGRQQHQRSDDGTHARILPPHVPPEHSRLQQGVVGKGLAGRDEDRES